MEFQVGSPRGPGGFGILPRTRAEYVGGFIILNYRPNGHVADLPIGDSAIDGWRNIPWLLKNSRSRKIVEILGIENVYQHRDRRL